MRRLPPPLGAAELLCWRLEKSVHAASWNSGEGAFRLGGRWSPRGVRAVYCALDAASAILEVAVHTGFAALDTVPHIMTTLRIASPADVHVVQPEDVPNPNWLHPGYPSAGQQHFGAEMLALHGVVVFPSVVSAWSWNAVLTANAAANATLLTQQRFALDPRLHPL